MQRRAVHTRGLKDLTRDFLEVSVQHPDDDRQVHQHQDDNQTNAAVENPEFDENQVDRVENANRRQHLGGKHPEKNVFGAFARHESHRPGGGHRDDDAKDRRSPGDDDRVPEEPRIVGAFKHR